MTPERIAELRRLAEAVHECAVSWEPNARLIGNVMASELAGFSVALPELLDALQAKDAEIEELKIDVASAEYLDSEAQIGAAEVSKELSALREENAALRARCERLEKVREAAEKVDARIGHFHDAPSNDGMPMLSLIIFAAKTLQAALAKARGE